MRRRSWPFAAALALFVALLGVLPHLRFSLLVGEPTYFFSAYDEGAYALWAFAGGGPLLPHRWLSSAVLVLLSKLAGGSWGGALVLADVVLPGLCALLAWVLIGRLTKRRLLRLVLALGVLFAQEFFSLGCWTIWRFGDPMAVTFPESPVLDLRALRSVAPHWVATLWPDYASPFLSLFRTPEPQLSLILLFGILTVLLDVCHGQEAQRVSGGRVWVGVLVNLVLGASYFFVATAIVVFEAALSIALLARRARDPARVVGGLMLTGAVSTALGVLTFHGDTQAQGYSFPSHLPVATPSSIAAAAGLGVLATFLRRRRERGVRDGDALLTFAAACFATVLLLTNQQVLSGRMISTREWERSVDYPIVFLGVAIGSAWLIRRRRVHPRVLYALGGAALVTGVSVLVGAQDRVFEQEFLVANLKSLAMKRAVKAAETRGLRDTTLLLEEPGLELLLQVRLERRVAHLLDVTRVFARPIDALGKPNGLWGRRSPHRREAFEYFARRPRTPAATARILGGQADAGAEFLRFFFDPRDFWDAMTDGRHTRLGDVQAHLPSIVRDFEEYLRTGDPCWFRPLVILTRESAAQRANARWKESFLAEVTVGRDQPLMNMHAYLQTFPGLPAAGAPLDFATCDQD